MVAASSAQPASAQDACPLSDGQHPVTRMAGLLAALPDVTGDGRDDYLVRSETGIDLMAGPMPGTRHASFTSSQRYLITAATGDLDADGDVDLVVGTPWASEVMVLFAPIAPGTANLSDAPLRITNPPRDLANRFGLGVHVADVTGDGIVDLVIGASAEGEEGCFGTDDTVAYAGPLGPGRLDEDDATVRIPAATTKCMGFPMVTTRMGNPPRPVLLLGGRQEVVWFNLPLGVAAVAGRAPGHDFAAAKDLDDDGRMDFVFDRFIQYGDGRTVAFDVPFTVGVHVFESVAWSTDQNDVIVGTGSAGRATFHRLIDGVADPRRLPVIATADPSGGYASSTADLDGDGLRDLVLGELVVRCR
jgi:hypothetical protein